MRTLLLRLPLAAPLAFVVLAPSSSAQQFQQLTNFPGTARWSEGIECADVDHDGDLDIFVADGEGFAGSGTARQNVLVINKLVEIGAWTLADESVARLGTHLSDAKGVATGDINGDGWVDALFCNAFNTAPPSLYVNQGAANPGFFTFEGVARGFVTSHSAGSAQFGDLDDDGDLDVIISDAYNNSTTSGRPHLYFNDGTGVFTENAAALSAPLKFGHMDVQLVDIDNDLDLDFFGPNKFTSAGGNHYLMLNNGAGTFSDVSSSIAVASGNSYEAEAGDLDGDNDLDLFFVSLVGLQEGAVRNNLVGLGTLTFTNQAALAGAVDDNEISCIDYDVDGDYDLLVGSLAGTREALWRNNGAFSFTNDSAQVQAITDPTLDCTVADLNNDGRYDILTVQGESNAAQWANKFYRNTGPVDTRAPVVVAHTNPASAPSAGPWVVHAKIRDQVLDDGQNWVSASALYTVVVDPIVVDVSLTDAGFSASPAVVPGRSVRWTNNSSIPRNVRVGPLPWNVDSGTIAVGASFTYTFVTPATYVITSDVGALTAGVTCSGTAETAITTYSGGQIYRFRMNDVREGLGTQVCYELRFVDWAGNVTVTGSRCIALVASGPATSFCSGDGSTATACPCGNDGTDGRGCANSIVATGGWLTASGATNPDTVVLHGSGMPVSATTIYLKGDALFVGGTIFGDGVSCCGGSLIRLRTKTNVGGQSSFPEPGDPSVSVRGATPPGSGLTGYYQAYYRNAASFCLPETYNITSGLQIAW